VPVDLVALGQDPQYGGGAVAQIDAFLAGARELGRRPELIFAPHPGLRGKRLTWRRVEALRELEASRLLVPQARDARSCWVVATVAHYGGAAPRAHRRYGCWLGTSIVSEWSGRAIGLGRAKRIAAASSLRTLRAIEQRVVAEAARVYATSAASAAQIATATSCSPDEIGLLPIPVDSNRFFPDDDWAWHERAVTKPLIGFVGRASDPRKNVSLLLEAFPLVRLELPTAALVLIGEPPSHPTGPAVQATGVVDEVASYVRRCTLLVLSSFQEGFGVVVAEALASGVPVVVTPCGGPEAIVRDSGGGRISPGWSARDLADTVLELLGDVAALDVARRAGRSYVEREHAPARFRSLLAEALDAVDG
jgi:glycosyltransferase involved in cell wall biosynthesis